jgi:MFS family permease
MRINKFIKTLIGAEVALGSASSLLGPIFAIFIVDSIEGGSLEIAGTAVAISLVTKSIIRVPLAYHLDKSTGELTDYYSMLIGFLLFAFTQFMFLWAETPIHIYSIQLISGLAIALAYTPWYGLFSKKLDSHHEDYEWSVGNSLSGIGAAIASYTGGVVAQNYGFHPLFVISGILMLVGALSLTTLKDSLRT